MSREKNMKKIILLITVLSLSTFVSAGFFSDDKDKVKNEDNVVEQKYSKTEFHGLKAGMTKTEVGDYLQVNKVLKYVQTVYRNKTVDDLLISQPDCGEDALTIAESLIRSSAVDVLVIDSVAALVPRAEIEGQMGDSHMGLQARLMSQALRKLTAATSRSNCALIFINQVREKIGGGSYGGPQETTTGGRALKFYASMRIDIRGIGQIKGKNDERIGHKAKVKIVKNKLAPPFKEATVEIYYGEGISREADLLNLGEELGIIKKSGAWYAFEDVRLGQGKENARQFLKENPEIANEIEKLRVSVKNGTSSG
jgi:recombination protein RecA